MRAVANFGRDLKMSMVAEGAETEHQLELVARLGRDKMQGYLCNPQRPAAEIRALPRRRQARLVGGPNYLIGPAPLVSRR